MFTKMKLFLSALLFMALSMMGFSAYAVGPDLTALTAAVDFSTVTTAIMAVAALIVVVYLAWKGARMVIAAVRGL